MLTRYERTIVKALYRHAVGQRALDDHGVSSDDIIEFSERFLGDLPPEFATLYRLGLLFYEFAPPLFVRRLARFTKLPAAEQARYVELLSHHPFHPLRMAFKATCGICLAAFYAQPVVQGSLGLSQQEE